MSNQNVSSDVTGRVLVFGADTRSFLTAARSLGRKGVQVHGVGCRESDPASHSKYITQIHTLPEYRIGQDEEWIEKLIRILTAERYDLLIPCADSFIIPLHENRRRIEPLCRMAIPEEQNYDLLFNKCQTHTLISRLSIPAPRV